MAALACDLCGGKLVMGAGGIATCEVCGMEYSTERMREKIQELRGSAPVEAPRAADNSHMIENYLGMAKSALEANNNAEAENYANKIIEIQPQSAEAWLIKGNAAGWQTTGRNNRYPESIVAWIKAYECASEEEKPRFRKEIKDEAMNISHAILKMECNSFESYQSKDNLEDITNAVSMIEKQLGTLKEKTSIDVYTDSFKTILARAINTAAVKGSDDADKDFGPDRSDKTKYAWTRYTESQDRCLTLLDKAYDLCFDDSLCHTISKNYIQIATAVRDSCSYKYQSGGYYSQDYSFTTESKNNRTKAINKWEEKRDKHDPEKRKANCTEAKALLEASQGEAERQQAIKLYWQEHVEERNQLEAEKNELNKKNAYLQQLIERDADRNAIAALDAQISSIKAQMDSLGLFKGKEKKVLAAQIDELAAKRGYHQGRWAQKEQRIHQERGKLNVRRTAIDAEFTKFRGQAKAVPAKQLPLFSEDRGLVTGLDLLNYYREILPAGFAVKGEGDDAIVNYTQLLLMKAKAMVAIFGALLGNKDAMDDVDFNYEDNPEVYKDYRINFTVNGEDSNVSLNFRAKTPDSPITRAMHYELEEEKTPQAVCNFIRIVATTITGHCPDLDVATMEEKIAEIAFGLSSETTLYANGMVCEITGSTKADVKVKLVPSEK